MISICLRIYSNRSPDSWKHFPFILVGEDRVKNATHGKHNFFDELIKDDFVMQHYSRVCIKHIQLLGINGKQKNKKHYTPIDELFFFHTFEEDPEHQKHNDISKWNIRRRPCETSIYFRSTNEFKARRLF